MVFTKPKRKSFKEIRSDHLCQMLMRGLIKLGQKCNHWSFGEGGQKPHVLLLLLKKDHLKKGFEGLSTRS